NRVHQHERSGDDFVLRCELGQFFSIEKNQATCDKVNRIVDDISPSSFEVISAQPVKHQCHHRDPPCSLLVSNQETEEREQHVEYKNDCQCPTHTNNRNLSIRQKPLTQ